eukprot:CAMPEP_0119467640 /NCGR_PEP_ID=MMETSP1344-20130328/1735_1 /TAXON_ID=236787 /ORGANISM="Florenciella parvula, Strain CCMP2471" /LENGTH=375 /DNA_ID=CAMNT_0007500025 /DNA_START=150 /DNA_END=1274 /DNA_ORIENTATION=+
MSGHGHCSLCKKPLSSRKAGNPHWRKCPGAKFVLGHPPLNEDGVGGGGQREQRASPRNEGGDQAALRRDLQRQLKVLEKKVRDSEQKVRDSEQKVRDSWRAREEERILTNWDHADELRELAATEQEQRIQDTWGHAEELQELAATEQKQRILDTWGHAEELRELAEKEREQRYRDTSAHAEELQERDEKIKSLEKKVAELYELLKNTKQKPELERRRADMAEENAKTTPNGGEKKSKRKTNHGEAEATSDRPNDPMDLENQFRAVDDSGSAPRESQENNTQATVHDSEEDRERAKQALEQALVDADTYLDQSLDFDDSAAARRLRKSWIDRRGRPVTEKKVNPAEARDLVLQMVDWEKGRHQTPRGFTSDNIATK